MCILKKTTAALCMLVLTLSFVGCSGTPLDKNRDAPAVTRNDEIDELHSNEDTEIASGNDEIKETPDSNMDTAIVTGSDEISEPLYYFIEGIFLGSFDDNGWHSLCDTAGGYKHGSGNEETFYAKDLLAVEKYYIYEKSEPARESTQIIWMTEGYGLGSFEMEDVSKEFSKYGEFYHFKGNSDTMYRIFNLPLKVGEELDGLTIPAYDFYAYFARDGKVETYDTSNYVVTNGDIKPGLDKVTYDSNPTLEGTRVLLDLFKEKSMDNTIPNFTNCVRGDFDSDGQDECVMAANSPRSKDGWPQIAGEGTKNKVGTFFALLYQEDDNNVQVLHSDIRPMSSEVSFENGYAFQLGHVVSVLPKPHGFIDVCFQRVTI